MDQEQLATYEIYKDNRELCQKLVAKNLEVLVLQGREGNATWQKQQIWEA
jgi:hypothetical protein